MNLLSQNSLKITLAGALFMMAAQTSNALDFKAKIRSISKSKSKVSVSSQQLSLLKKGDILNIGYNCSLEVSRVNRSRALLSTELCEEKRVLKKGRTLTFDLESSSSNQSSTKRGSYFGNSPEKASEGFRVGLSKAFLDYKLSADSRFWSDTDRGEVDHDFGVSLGYVNLGARSLGFMANFTYSQFNNKSNSVRIEGSGAYGVNQYFHLLGGLNLHHFTKGSLEKELDPGLGFQFGVGAQLTPNFGLGLKYIALNNSGSVNGLDIESELKGFELGFHGTF